MQFRASEIQISWILTSRCDRSCITEVYLRRLIRVSDAKDHIPVACQMLHQQLILGGEAKLQGVIEYQYRKRPIIRRRNRCVHMRVRRDVAEIAEQQALSRVVALIELLKERPNREAAECTLLRRIPDLNVKLTVACRGVSFLPRVIRNGVLEGSYTVRT